MKDWFLALAAIGGLLAEPAQAATQAAETSFMLSVAAVIGLIPAFIAGRTRPSHFLLWWLFGAMLFVVALPMSLISHYRSKHTCSHCHRRIKIQEQSCPYCQHSVARVSDEWVAS